MCLPHCLDPTTLETTDEETLGGTLELNMLGARFQYDPVLDRLVTMSAMAGINRLSSLQINEYGRQWAVKDLQMSFSLVSPHQAMQCDTTTIYHVVLSSLHARRKLWTGFWLNMEFVPKLWLGKAPKVPGLLTGFNVRFEDAHSALNGKPLSTTPFVHQTVLHPASFEFPAVQPYHHGQDTIYLHDGVK
ncbi:hypothetical protein BGZ50_008105 [Haplosporangium sp. Z 11]|nr:hypothetical protein BGZ50_008105 [Haplosporangium sp. Z 11]